MHDACGRDAQLLVVLVNAAVEGIGLPTVATDDGHAVEQAYGHLTSLGHERIGIVLGPADHVPSARKHAALQRLFLSGAGRGGAVKG